MSRAPRPLEKRGWSPCPAGHGPPGGGDADRSARLEVLDGWTRPPGGAPRQLGHLGPARLRALAALLAACGARASRFVDPGKQRKETMSLRPSGRSSRPRRRSRRWREAAARLRVRQDEGLSTRSCSSTTSATRTRRLPRRVPLAPPPRHRDDHVRAGGSVEHGTARQPASSPRRRAVDDGRSASSTGDAEGRRPRPHARLPALANLPASLKMTDPRYQDILAHDPGGHDDDGTRRGHLRRVLGQRGRQGGRPTRATWTSRSAGAPERLVVR